MVMGACREPKDFTDVKSIDGDLAWAKGALVCATCAPMSDGSAAASHITRATANTAFRCRRVNSPPHNDATWTQSLRCRRHCNGLRPWVEALACTIMLGAG